MVRRYSPWLDGVVLSPWGGVEERCDHGVVGRPGVQDLGVPREVAVLRPQGALRRRRVPIAHRRVDPAAVLQLDTIGRDADAVVVLAVREYGFAWCKQIAAHGDEENDGYDEADDRADVRLAAVVFVRSAADVRNATIQRNSVAPLALGLLPEDPALDVNDLFAALVAAGGGGNREGDEREEVLRNKHGGGAALRCTGAALSEVECRFSRESESSKS